MDILSVKKVVRKSTLLKAPAFGCLQGVPSLNLTRGCLHRCVYCYARAFPETPDQEVHLYTNLCEKLRGELDAPRRRKEISLVTFSTASDLFQPHPEILDMAFGLLRLVLARGIRISFLTKGRIPEKIWSLLQEYKPLVSMGFGLVSLSAAYHRAFEPFTAPPYVRLRQIEKSAKRGWRPKVRLDPLIPGLTDHEEALESLIRHLAQCGAEEVTASYLVLRPGVLRQMSREGPRKVLEKIMPYYKGQPWQRVITSATTKLPQREIRKRGYQILKEIGRAYDVKVKICGCKNPDLPFESCVPWETNEKHPPRQGNLFDLSALRGKNFPSSQL